MGLFGRQEPSPVFAAEEQQRGDNLANRIGELAEHPGSEQHAMIPHFQAAARNAYGNAAGHGEQPKGRPS